MIDFNEVFIEEVDSKGQDIHTVTIMGSKGQGKTRLLMAMAYTDNNRLKIVWDTVGIMENLPSVRIEAKSLIKNIEHLEKNLIEIIPFAVQKNIPLVIDCSGLKKSELVEFADLFSEYLMLNKIECSLYIDEVGDYIPQNHMGYSERLEQLIRVGRNYNISPVVLITQRPQKASKDCLALSDVYVTFQLNFSLDRVYLMKLWGSGDAGLETTLKSLTPRNVLLWLPKWKEPIINKVVKVNM